MFVAGMPVPANGTAIEAAVAEIARESLRRR
jgi:hypothetical protein